MAQSASMDSKERAASIPALECEQNDTACSRTLQENNKERSHISFKGSSVPRATWQFQFYERNESTKHSYFSYVRIPND